MLIAVRWLQLKMPWKWQPRLCLKLVVAPILMLICNDLIFAAKMSWNLLGCLSWTIGKSRISARIWFCLRLGVETGAVEERLASIRRMLSVRLWDVDRAAERIQTKDIWFILMYSHGFQHDLATPHGKNRRIWKIRRERERERVCQYGIDFAKSERWTPRFVLFGIKPCAFVYSRSVWV